MTYTDEDRLIALAGVFQTAALVRDIARTGQYDSACVETSLSSLFIFDASSVPIVFGGSHNIRYGLKILHTQLQTPQQRDIEIAQYVVALIHLADKLAQNEASLQAIANALDILNTNKKNFAWSISTLSAQLADIYQKHISAIQPQIIVRGEPGYLQSSDNAMLIRSLLFAGIRAAILWRQCGGKKRHLLFSRRKVAFLAKSLLDGFDAA